MKYFKTLKEVIFFPEKFEKENLTKMSLLFIIQKSIKKSAITKSPIDGNVVEAKICVFNTMEQDRLQ